MKLQRQLITWDEGIELAAYQAVECSGVASYKLTDEVSRRLNTSWAPSLIEEVLQVIAKRAIGNEDN